MTSVSPQKERHPPAASTGDSIEMLVMLRRGLAFLAVWHCLIGVGWMHFFVGVFAASVATWVSIVLWPRGAGCASARIPRYAIGFVGQSVGAGFQVAKYAFARHMTLRPGFMNYQTRLLPGMRREALCTVLSLQPGTMPVDTDPDGTIRVHCLDLRQNIAAELSHDEAIFLTLLKREQTHG